MARVLPRNRKAGKVGGLPDRRGLSFSSPLVRGTERPLATVANVDDDHKVWSGFLVRQNVRQHDQTPRAGHGAARAALGKIRECLPGSCKSLDQVACGGRVTLNFLLEEINRVTGKNVAGNYGEPRQGDIKHSQADIEKAVSRMGYRPHVSFEEGLKKTVEWYRENLPQAVSER